MKTINCRILAAVVGAIAALNLHASYDPTTGRWCSRDPIEEQGGRSLYCFINNDPIYQIDLLGLDILGTRDFPFFTLDLGKHAPEQKIGIDGKQYWQGGVTILKDWLVVAYPKQGSPCSANSWRIWATGHASVKYWWADLSVKSHEETHVAIWEYEWNDLASEVEGLMGRCFCSERKARCFSNLAKSLASMYRLRGSIKNDDFDCKDYGNQWGACDRAKADAVKLHQYDNQVYKYRMQCENMP